MKVKELIHILNQYNEDTDVLIDVDGYLRECGHDELAEKYYDSVILGVI